MRDRLKTIDPGDSVEIQAPPEVLEALKSVRRERHHNAHNWQEWEDEILLKCWNDPHYTKRRIAQDVLKVNYNTALDRYRELTRHE